MDFVNKILKISTWLVSMSVWEVSVSILNLSIRLKSTKLRLSISAKKLKKPLKLKTKNIEVTHYSAFQPSFMIFLFLDENYFWKYWLFFFYKNVAGMNKVIQNCSVFPFLEKYEADMIYRIQINGCSLQVQKYSVK